MSYQLYLHVSKGCVGDGGCIRIEGVDGCRGCSNHINNVGYLNVPV